MLDGQDSSVSIEGTTADEAFGRAKALLQKNEWAAALAPIKRAVQLAPDNITYNLALAQTLFLVGELSQAGKVFDKTLSLEDNRTNTTNVTDIGAFKRDLFAAPQTTVACFLQGTHAPERQVFMSAAVDLVTRPGASIAILEIGSYAGSSLLTWSGAAGHLVDGTCEITCIDPWGAAGADLYDEQMGESLRSSRVFDVFRHNASLCAENVGVIPLKGTSRAVLPELEEGAYDLIYIDGSHHYADVLFDLAESRRLLKPGGILCGDDLEVQLSQADRSFLETHKQADIVVEPVSGQHCHPGVTLAVGECLGEVSSFSGFWAMRSTPNGFEKVTFKDATGIRPSHWPEPFQTHISAYFDRSDELGQLI